MAYGTPSDPIAGTVITVAYAVANIVDPIRWLRLMTGNADPPGSSYVVSSTSTSGTSWAKITADMIADGSVSDGKLEHPKVNKAGDTMTNHLTFTPELVGVKFSGGGYLSDQATPIRTLLEPSGNRLDIYDQGGAHQIMQIDYALSAPTFKGTPLSLDTHAHAYIPTAGGNYTGFLHAITDGVGVQFSGGGVLRDTAAPLRTLMNINGSRLDIYDPAGGLELFRLDASNITYKGTGLSLVGHTHAYLPLAGGTLSGAVTLSTDGLGVNWSSGGNMRDTSSPQRTILSAAGDRFEIFNEGSTAQMLALNQSGNVATVHGATIIHSGNIGAQDVASVGGRTPTATPGPNRIPISDATGTLNSWVTGTGIGVQIGIVAMVRTVAEIPAGWLRETLLDGLVPVGAGTSFGVPHDEGTAYGSSWSHQHAATGLTFSGTFSGTGGTTGDGSASTNQANVTTPATAFSLGSHTHGYTPAGTIGGSVAGNVASAAWVIPSRAYVFVRKTT